MRSSTEAIVHADKRSVLLETIGLYTQTEVLIVPTGISNCSMVEENHLGLVMHSPEEAASAVEAVTELEYQEYVRCVAE